MLVLLEIQDFGLIDRVSLEFTPGLNVLTGETGAGKSIIVDALQVVLGQRASGEYIRTGREKACLTAVFNVSGCGLLQEKLTGWGIPEEEDGTLVMTRELTRSGRNTCRLNGQAVTAGLYREAGRFLVALQGQHEQQALLVPERQLALLDRFGGAQTSDLAKAVKEIYGRWRAAQDRLQEALNSAQDRARRLDMLSYQIEEIDKAGLSFGEEEELLKERTRLANAEKILSLAGECSQFLQGNEGSPFSALDCLGQARRSLAELSRLDDSVAPLLGALESAFYQIEDAAREIAGYREQIQADPGRLQLIEERLAVIKNLKRKYGATITEILHYREQAAREQARLAALEEDVGVLEQEISRLAEAWRRAARELTLARQEAARRLQKAITAELASLEMSKVEFCVEFEQVADISSAGQERIAFLISPNPGEPLRPLTRIASGGELSRIMLALRTILASLDETPTLVFDEVDTGIGGRTLQAVAEKLSRIAAHAQVICVTHAAQVACRADNHYYVFKEAKDRQTNIYVRTLPGEERLKEIARMLAGKDDGLAWEHARQLLQQAKLARETQNSQNGTTQNN